MKLSTHDLPLFFEEHHQALADSLVAVGETLRAEESQEHTLAYAADVARRMGEEMGLYSWLAPQEGPVDIRALCLIRECLGYVSPLADGIFAVQGLGSSPIRLAGTRDEHMALLDRVRRGDIIGGFALTEPGAGSDVVAIATAAVLDGDGQQRLLLRTGGD